MSQLTICQNREIRQYRQTETNRQTIVLLFFFGCPDESNVLRTPTRFSLSEGAIDRDRDLHEIRAWDRRAMLRYATLESRFVMQYVKSRPSVDLTQWTRRSSLSVRKIHLMYESELHNTKEPQWLTKISGSWSDVGKPAKTSACICITKVSNFGM
jgi:hypothetical protein